MDQDLTNNSGLVSLQERKLARRHPALIQVEGYWEALKGGRLVPDRSEVDPRGLSGALEHAFVLERIAPGLARFRVAGMHLSDLMGLEVRGMPISATFTPDARPKLATALEAAFNEPARIQMRLEGEDGVGRSKLQGEMLLLPLRSDAGDVTRALGCLVMTGQIGRQPRRISITQMEHRTLVGYADGGISVDVKKDLGPQATQSRPKTQPVAGAPHLKLVHSRD